MSTSSNSDVCCYCGITAKCCLVYIGIIATGCHYCSPWKCVVITSTCTELTCRWLTDCQMKYYSICTCTISNRKVVVATCCIACSCTIPCEGSAGYYCCICMTTCSNSDVCRYCGVTAKCSLIYIGVISTCCHYCSPWKCIVIASTCRELAGLRLTDCQMQDHGICTYTIGNRKVIITT